MERAIVNKIIPFSAVDGPGNRAAIFLQGCNFNCLYCHNPETVNVCNDCGICVSTCPAGALLFNDNGKVIWQEEVCTGCDNCLKECPRDSSPRVREMSAGEIVDKLRELKPFISGITVSGGEAMLQDDFVAGLFKKAKKLGLTTYLDTNGSFLLKDKEELLENMDQAMIDLKAFDPVEHRKLTGIGNTNVLANIKFLGQRGKLYEVRTVIVPELLDNTYNVHQTSKVLAKLDPTIRYKLIKYRQVGVRTDKLKAQEPDSETMEELADLARSNGCKNVIVV